jgi:hypothetical protein
MTTETYSYIQLGRKDAIRILHLLPAQEREAPVRISLHEIPFPLDLKSIEAYTWPSFEALSYVWGAKSGDQPIQCEGKQLLITPNCESALRHLRLPTKTRTLWVDSICINQESEEEKSYQVHLMWEIYQHAQQVIIWLGPGSPLTPRAFQWMREWRSRQVCTIPVL